jgi:DNA repair protein RadC
MGKPKPEKTKSAKTKEDFTAGHRSWMQEKFRSHGGDSLPHEELLEMLFYANFQRGDVKPLIKSLYSRVRLQHMPCKIVLPRLTLCIIIPPTSCAQARQISR